MSTYHDIVYREYLKEMDNEPIVPELLGAPKRRQYKDLHAKDQAIKSGRSSRIKQNWKCDSVQHCLPVEIRPRVEFRKGAKARIGDANICEEIWWNWSVELLRSLEELSGLTATRLDFAQELLKLEVRQRQDNTKHPQRKILELLLGDVQRVVEGIKESNRQQAEMGDYVPEDLDAEHYDEAYHAEGMEEDIGEGGAGMDEMPINNNNNMATAYDTKVTNGGMTTRGGMTAHGGMANHAGTTTHYGTGTGTGNYGHSPSPTIDYGGRSGGLINNPYRQTAAMEVDAMGLRARALRLRAQANRFEADAAELEVHVAELSAQLE